MEQILYTSAVESLMYAQVCTRPDITFIVGMLSRYLSNPRKDHWNVVKHVMRYLQGSKDHMLVYRKSYNLDIIGYSDSDFTGCQDSCRSTSGYVFILAGGAISWKSVKQTLIASSTMAAEYIVCYEESNQALWLQNFIVGLRIMTEIERPLRLLCDSSSAVQFSNNNRSLSKSKHIDIKYLVVNKRTQNEHVSLEHIGTDSMIAYHLTKGLPPKVFHKYIASVGVLSLDDVLF
ncbi:unnamed protein product [Victoria cruziana]